MSGTLTLVFETSTPHASLALFGPGGLLAERRFSSERNHNALVFAPLAELMALRGDRTIGLVLVGSGPGSYSGTRVGIAAAQGVAMVCGCPAVSVPSLLAVPAAEKGAACLAIGDARRGNFWTAPIADDRLIAAPEITDAAGLQQQVATGLARAQAVFSFEEVGRYPLGPDLLMRVKVEIPDAGRLFRCWQEAGEDTRENWSAAVPQPIYLQPPHITPAKRRWLPASQP